MTEPRPTPTRELYGILGSLADSSVELKKWHHFFAFWKIDAVMTAYPTKPKDLPSRLSEMCHFDRRGYIVSGSLKEAIVPLLDSVDASAGIDGVDTVWNDGGVLRGSYLGGNFEARCREWGLTK